MRLAFQVHAGSHSDIGFQLTQFPARKRRWNRKVVESAETHCLTKGFFTSAATEYLADLGKERVNRKAKSPST